MISLSRRNRRWLYGAVISQGPAAIEPANPEVRRRNPINNAGFLDTNARAPSDYGISMQRHGQAKTGFAEDTSGAATFIHFRSRPTRRESRSSQPGYPSHVRSGQTAAQPLGWREHLPSWRNYALARPPNISSAPIQTQSLKAPCKCCDTSTA